MPDIGFKCVNGQPTLAVWLESNGMGVQRFRCDKPFWIRFKNEDWPGEGKGVGPGGTGPNFLNAQQYYSGEVVGNKAMILLRFCDASSLTRNEIVAPGATEYDFAVRIEDYEEERDRRLIPD